MVKGCATGYHLAKAAGILKPQARYMILDLVKTLPWRYKTSVFIKLPLK